LVVVVVVVVVTAAAETVVIVVVVAGQHDPTHRTTRVQHFPSSANLGPQPQQNTQDQ